MSVTILLCSDDVREADSNLTQIACFVCAGLCHKNFHLCWHARIDAWIDAVITSPSPSFAPNWREVVLFFCAGLCPKHFVYAVCPSGGGPASRRCSDCVGAYIPLLTKSHFSRASRKYSQYSWVRWRWTVSRTGAVKNHWMAGTHWISQGPTLITTTGSWGTHSIEKLSPSLSISYCQ